MSLRPGNTQEFVDEKLNQEEERRGQARRGQRAKEILLVVVFSTRSGLSLVQKKSARQSRQN